MIGSPTCVSELVDDRTLLITALEHSSEGGEEAESSLEEARALAVDAVVVDLSRLRRPETEWLAALAVMRDQLAIAGIRMVVRSSRPQRPSLESAGFDWLSECSLRLDYAFAKARRTARASRERQVA
jgi:hypothetical protein